MPQQALIKKNISVLAVTDYIHGMTNIVDYTGSYLYTFRQKGFNELDALALSYLSYFRFPSRFTALRSNEGMKLRDLNLAEHYEMYFSGTFDAKSSKELFRNMTSSPRYRDVTVKYVTEKLDEAREKQFAALCFELVPGTLAVSFRGTDASFTGWKEDFNMSFTFPVPSQKEAKKYLEKVAGDSDRIYVMGHSKGGNLAVYAAMMAREDVKARIKRIYSLDGPGFPEEALKSREFRSILARLVKIVPQSSIIGLLLKNPDRLKIVKSSSLSLFQHDPYTWVVEENSFKEASKLSSEALKFNRKIDAALSTMESEERRMFVDTLFEIVCSTGAADTDDFFKHLPKTLPSSLLAYSRLSDEKKDLMKQAFSAMRTLK